MKMEKLAAPTSPCVRDLFRRSSTYLAKIAVVLQGSPDKMLTFSQLMDRLGPLMREDRKSVENNIRVCLSTNKCFVKIPMVPDSVTKRNYWKLDLSQITPKMARRHFKEILELFPELRWKMEMGDPTEAHSVLRSPEAGVYKSVRIKRGVKFNSPFSIESILRQDSPSPRGCPLAVRTERQHRPPHIKKVLSWDSEELLLQLSAGSTPMYSAGGATHQRLADRMVKPMRPMHENAEPCFPSLSTASYQPGSHNGYITYPMPAFSHDPRPFRL